MLEFWIAGNKGSGDRKRNGKRLRKASAANCWIGGVKCRETWRWRRWRLVARHAASRWCEPSFLWLSSFIEVQTFKLRIPMLISSLMPVWCWSLGHAFTLSTTNDSISRGIAQSVFHRRIWIFSRISWSKAEQRSVRNNLESWIRIQVVDMVSPRLAVRSLFMKRVNPKRIIIELASISLSRYSLCTKPSKNPQLNSKP